MLGSIFGGLEVERWDAPLLELPDRDAVRDYLAGKGVAPEHARRAADADETPLRITKRGTLLFGRKR